MYGIVHPQRWDDIKPLRRAMIGDSAFSTKNFGGKIVRERRSREKSGLPGDAAFCTIDIIHQMIMPSGRKIPE